MAMPDGGPARPTIYDVARLAGVSKSLVSLVLQGSTKVSEPRRAAVQAAITELGYRPSRAATLLASHRTKSIEVVIDDYRNLSFVRLLEGLRSELTAHGYHLSVTDSRIGQDGGGGVLSTNLDGLVIAAESADSLLEGWTGPTVVAGWRATIPGGADLVANDDELGARIAVDHLVHLGHRSIGHLTGSGGPAAHRRTGFLAAMAGAHLRGAVAGEDGGTAEEDGFRSAADLFDRFPDTTAVFAANDTMALGAFAAIRARGLQVPEDVSVIGYDNSPLAESRFLDITSVDDRSDVVGAGAGRALLSRFDEPARDPLRTLIEPTLTIRGTTAQIRPVD